MTGSLRITDEVVSVADSAFEKVKGSILLYEGLGARQGIGTFLEPERSE